MSLTLPSTVRLAAVIAIASTALACPSARGAVAVLSNRTTSPLTVAAVVDGAAPQPLRLRPGDARPVFGLKTLAIGWSDGAEIRETTLKPGRAYFFGETGGDRVALEQIGLNDRPGPPLLIADNELLLDATPTLRLKVLVDDDERRRRNAWEPRLRARIAAASEIIEAHCGVRLEIVAFDSWESDNREHDFERSLDEFEREVLPAPADVAIGFSSQYIVQTGRIHLGGTRKPLHSHILLKERSRGVLERERLELLVHELGHLLGAAHSPEQTSVMRPVITGGLQRMAGSTVQFDPVNTLAMSLVADEMRLRRVRSVGAMTSLTRRRLAAVYAALDPTLPDDPAAGIYQQLVGTSAGAAVIDDARKIMGHIVRVAELKDKAPLAELGPADAPTQRSDRLLEWYVRQAAAAAGKVNRETAPHAFLLAVGAALDDQGQLAKLPLVSKIEHRLETESERQRRVPALGTPTMRGRADLAKHFFISAHLVPILGSERSRAVGMMKELADAHGGSGFSFADMTANRAGIVFAHAVLGGRMPLDRVAREFTIDAVLPSLEELPEGLQAKAFADDYGGLTDARLAAEMAKIETRVMALPIYATSP